MRRQATILVTLAFIFAAAASATTAPSVKDPSSLQLRRSDLLAESKYTWGDVPASALGGASGRGVYYQATLPVSSDKFEQISGLVVATVGASQATKLFGQFARRPGAADEPGDAACPASPPLGDDHVRCRPPHDRNGRAPRTSRVTRPARPPSPARRALSW